MEELISQNATHQENVVDASIRSTSRRSAETSLQLGVSFSSSDRQVSRSDEIMNASSVAWRGALLTVLISHKTVLGTPLCYSFSSSALAPTSAPAAVCLSVPAQAMDLFGSQQRELEELLSENKSSGLRVSFSLTCVNRLVDVMGESLGDEHGGETLSAPDGSTELPSLHSLLLPVRQGGKHIDLTAPQPIQQPTLSPSSSPREDPWTAARGSWNGEASPKSLHHQLHTDVEKAEKCLQRTFEAECERARRKLHERIACLHQRHERDVCTFFFSGSGACSYLAGGVLGVRACSKKA